MKKILLASNAGMSTSMLVRKMRTAAEELGVEADINAVSVTEANERIADVDVVLLGPQVKFQEGCGRKDCCRPYAGCGYRYARLWHDER